MRDPGPSRAGATATLRAGEACGVEVDGDFEWSEENFFFALAAGVMLANVICAVVRLAL